LTRAADSYILAAMTSIINLTPTQLRAAADIQERIQMLQAELNSLLGQEELSAPFSTVAPGRRGKRGMSAAGRAAISAAAKARWAKLRAERGIAEVVVKPKRKLSAQGLANIRAGVAKRWGKKPMTQTSSEVKPKAKRSAAWRRALSEATKARWAKAKRLGKARL
jgi:hypothetical protein